MTTLYSIIQEDGSVDPAEDPGIPQDKILQWFKLMVQVRVMEDRLMALQRQGRIGFFAPCTGQEAGHIAAAAALNDEDWIFPQYREPGAILLRGWTLRQFLAQTLGSGEDIMKGRQMPNHFGDANLRFVTPSSPIGTQIPQAVGMAAAAKLRGDKTISLVFFGDGATSSSGFHDGMNFAGVLKAPVILFCQNNQYAISLPVSKQTASENIAIKGKAYGVDAVRVDGNDFLAVYMTVKTAAEKARSGGGPTLIESLTYRLGPHSTSDDPHRYRSESEEEKWYAKDPIIRLEKYLKKQNIIPDDYLNKLKEELTQNFNNIFKEAELVPPPAPDTLFEDVYDRLFSNLEEQRQQLIESLNGEGGKCPWQI